MNYSRSSENSWLKGEHKDSVSLITLELLKDLNSPQPRRITEACLCRTLEINRGPIRDALQKLHDQKIIIWHPGGKGVPRMITLHPEFLEALSRVLGIQ